MNSEVRSAQEVNPTAGGSSKVSPEQFQPESEATIVALAREAQSRIDGSVGSPSMIVNCHSLANLCAELQLLRAGWRDIATAPRDGRRFPVETIARSWGTSRPAFRIEMGWWSGTHWASDSGAIPTRWFDLPPPPEERANG